MKSFPLPKSIEVVQGPVGPRFRGPASALLGLAETFGALAKLPPGFVCRMGPVEVCVLGDYPDSKVYRCFAIPRHAWVILSCKFREVATGWEESPFDFGDCGYLWPRPDPDLGVELVGEPER